MRKLKCLKNVFVSYYRKNQVLHLFNFLSIRWSNFHVAEGDAKWERDGAVDFYGRKFLF